MPKEVKLQALCKTYQIEEQKALEEKQRIEDVVGTRQAVVDTLSEKRGKLLDKVALLRTKERGQALSSGDAVKLDAISRYQDRLRSQIEEVNVELEGRKKELKVARERLEIADQDLIDARLDRKKVEKFLDNRQLSERVIDAALEEALTDEMNFYRREK